MEISIFELTAEMTHILKSNAPIRTKPLGKTKYSPFPGNLKQNGVVMDTANGKVLVGGDSAPYALYTETKSKKAGWLKKSELDMLNRLLTYYGGTLE